MFNGNPVPDEVKCDIIEEEMSIKRINKDPPPKVMFLNIHLHDLYDLEINCF